MTRRLLPLLIVPALALSACRAPDHSPAPFHELEPAKDQNPSPTVVEINLVASPTTLEIDPGKMSPIWAYNGQFPGPLIEANVGDTLKIHFQNDLPKPTTIHWHGLRIPTDMDGTTMMMAPIQPGASFDYVFTVPDAGTFWYHPHVESDVQLARGLFGAIVVHGPGEPRVDVERTLVLSDMTVLINGSVELPGGMMDVMDGYEGNLMLVNGRPGAVLPMRAGEIQRWRLVNAANARFFKLKLDGHTFHVIGTDGGPLQDPYDADTLLMVPGSRYDVLVVGSGDPGAEIPLRALAYDRGQMSSPKEKVVATVKYSTASAHAAKPLPATAHPVESLPADAPSREMHLTEQGMMGFLINGQSWPNVTPVAVALNSTEVWSIVNDTHMDHPFHLHGQFFQPIEVNGVAEPRRAWKDTVNVPANTTVKVAVRHDNPGDWMYHCHIFTHSENGMAGVLHVGP